jgi:hypothetical protein
LVKASQPLRTSKQAKPRHDDCNEKKTRSSRSANASAKRREKSRGQTAKWSAIGRHEKSDLFGDTPRAFISNAKVTLQFFSGYAVFTLAHQEYRVEPKR